MANTNPNKPASNHPWRNRSIKVETWAKEKSTITNVSNVMDARPSTLSRKKSDIHGQL